MPKLQVIRGLTSRKLYEFTLEDLRRGDGVQIGRNHLKCQVAIEGKHLSVSREHFSITSDRDGVWLTDKSTQGTRLNGFPLRPQEHYPLHNKDQIYIPGFVFVYLEDDTPPVASVALDDTEEDDSSSDSEVYPLPPGDATQRLPSDKFTIMLRLIGDMLRSVSLKDTMSAMCGRILEEVFRHADHAALVMWDLKRDEPTSVFFQNRDRNEASAPTISMPLVQRVRKDRLAARSDDQLAICAPLISHDNRCLGVLWLDSSLGRRKFRTKDGQLLAVIAVQLGLVVDNLHLREAAIHDALIERELELAHEIQSAMLPDDAPGSDGYEFYHYYEPAESVGGDFVDYVNLAGTRIVVFLGDVSGKGIPASLQMARISSELRLLLEIGVGAVEAVQWVNQRMTVRPGNGNFATMVMIDLDMAAHRLVLLNAGHPRPRIRRTNGVLDTCGDHTGGLPLGIVPEENYQSLELTLEPGECLMFFSDGIPDANNSAGLRFTEERLDAEFAAANGTAKEIGEKLIQCLKAFVGSHPLTDDRCLVCIRRKP